MATHGRKIEFFEKIWLKDMIEFEFFGIKNQVT